MSLAGADICALCGGSATAVSPGAGPAPAAAFSGVTSDIKPWPRMGGILCCEACGHVQKRLDGQWRADAAAIYADYVMYHLSGGTEQVVFDTGQACPRTSRLITGMSRAWDLPQTGRLLDVGCGGGAFLAAFRQAMPGWKLYGHDHCAQRQAEVEAVPGVCGFHCGALEEAAAQNGPFDAVSLIYVLEHMPEPVAELTRLRGLLKPDGTLMVMVPDFAQNPFDLAVVDHCGHFFAETLAHAAELAGFDVLALGRHWMAKEVGFLARPRAGASASAPASDDLAPRRGLALAQGSLDWLRRTVDTARNAAEALHAKGRSFALFGTAIAGSWLAQELPGHVDCFVDEDGLRWGKTHLGLPISGPADVAPGTGLFLGFPPELASSIAKRLGPAHPGLELLLPAPR
ncbi:class I SAM-dependent methyltransferase [Humidesulfovibrio sp.]|uniref:class I SAM-dependent methyltransferase n=1 Tax=Humidesulfovibrio sp. TaxID=2910988 RepID=UPI002D7F0871|nr:class I SAM-dependent methyltransferase [Humidesulfovibrio sp.]